MCVPTNATKILPIEQDHKNETLNYNRAAYLDSATHTYRGGIDRPYPRAV